VEPAHDGEMPAQPRLRNARQRHGAVATAFGLADRELVAREVDVLDAETQRFEQPQAASIQERGDEMLHVRQPGQHSPHLRAREHDGQSLRATCTHGVVEAFELAPEHDAVEEEQRGQRLVLGRCCDLAAHRQIGKEVDDLGRAHLVWMALSMEQDEAPDPRGVRLLRAPAHVPQASGVADAVEESLRRRLHRSQKVGDTLRARSRR
jgi:hypothetical protein